MHSQLTPLRICKYAIVGVALSLVLYIVALCLPFYSYTYFRSGETITFFQVAGHNGQVYIPIISCIVCLVLLVLSLVFMIALSKKKVFQIASKTLSLISAFVFFGLFIIAICRLWVAPYEFSVVAHQVL